MKYLDLFYSKKFWIELVIFILSVIGAILIAYQNFNGFWLWIISNILSIIYFSYCEQYPLVFQQCVFLITSILGIYNNWNNIINA